MLSNYVFMLLPLVFPQEAIWIMVGDIRKLGTRIGLPSQAQIRRTVL